MAPAGRRIHGWPLVVALLAATSAPAQQNLEDIIALDSSRSSAEFKVKVVWLVRVRGHFDEVHGTVDVDRFRNQGVVDAHIDAARVRMGAPGYTNWVKSPEFFDVAKHPDIHFVSDAFPLQRLRTGGELPGHLSVRGSTGPVNFALAAATCPRPGYDCPIVASGNISRSEFGMRSRLGTLGDEVQLRLRIFASSTSGPLTP